MFEYYAQRAREYDRIYSGGGPASISDPQVYLDEVEILVEVVKRTCSGDLIDIACGTAFWLPHYADNCTRITLFDQSKEMLAEAQASAAAIGVAERTTVLSGDVLTYDVGQVRFDGVLVGFLLSHFTDDEETRFFRLLKSILKPDGRILILDSAWNDARARTRKKEGQQKRVLVDGREFEIYKKYFDESDLSAMARQHGITLTVEHFGKVFFAARVTMGQGQRPTRSCQGIDHGLHGWHGWEGRTRAELPPSCAVI